jgi:hypothetical protein
MSEPMTSGEIEDVLSSIRRLVSEDLRPQARAVLQSAPAPSVVTVPPSADREKLMLTPALRVVSPPDPAPVVDEARFVQVEDAPVVPEPTQRLRLDTVVATIGAAVSAPADGWEAETGDATVTRLSWVVPPDPQADAPRMAAEDAAAPATGDGAQAGGLHFARQARRAEQTGKDAAAGPPQRDRPDGGAEVEGATDVGAEERGAEDGAIDLDEAALRDLVRDMIREELQGPLGERITRNIRKLVRSEIARMQAARDLE